MPSLKPKKIFFLKEETIPDPSSPLFEIRLPRLPQNDPSFFSFLSLPPAVFFSQGGNIYIS